MADLEKALATQLHNIESRTGKSLAQLTDPGHVDVEMVAWVRAASDAAG